MHDLGIFLHDIDYNSRNLIKCSIAWQASRICTYHTYLL